MGPKATTPGCSGVPWCAKLWILFICSRYSSFAPDTLYFTTFQPSNSVFAPSSGTISISPKASGGKDASPWHQFASGSSKAEQSPGLYQRRLLLLPMTNPSGSECLFLQLLVLLFRQMLQSHHSAGLDIFHCRALLSQGALQPGFPAHHIQNPAMGFLGINQDAEGRCGDGWGKIKDIDIPPSPDVLPIPYRSPPYTNKLILGDFTAGVPPFPCPALTCRSPAASETSWCPSQVAQPPLVIHSAAK